MVATTTRSSDKEDSLLMAQVDGLKAVRCAAIYGANASGKTNLLIAMNNFSSMVFESQRTWAPAGTIPKWDPFRLDEHSRDQDTLFEIDFVLQDRVLNYGFEFNQRSISSEWLIDNSKKAKTLFRRMTVESKVSVAFPSKNLGSTVDESRLLDLVCSQTRVNSLFLSAAAQGNHDFLSSVFGWITTRFKVLYARNESLKYFTAELCSDPQIKSSIIGLLEAADTGIVDLEVAEEKPPEKIQKAVSAMLKVLEDGAPNGIKLDTDVSRHAITMIHNGQDGKGYPLLFENESAGTRAYFQLLGPILRELKDGTVLLIDELESSLHPRLASQLISFFNDPDSNPNGAQLIFTTHDSHLLNLDVMRRDQFWLTEKGNAGQTELVSLYDFKPRPNQNIELAYLNGRFGGVPFINESLSRSSIQSTSKEDTHDVVLK